MPELKTPEIPTAKSAKERYQELVRIRQPFLDQARRCAELTIPFLMPPEGTPDGSSLPTPYQSTGSRGVAHLASKLLLALLPPNTPFFRLVVDPFQLKKIANDEKARTTLETALSEVEQAVLMEIETIGTRVAMDEALRHVIVCGNALLYAPKGTPLRVLHLDRYVVQRDPMGNVVTIITHESIAPSVLPKDLQALVQDKDRPDKAVNLFTIIERSNGAWQHWQELDDKVVESTKGTYPIDRCPYIPIRFSRVDGEDYGRGLVEQVLGDLVSLEGLRKALVEGAAASSKVVFLVAPNGLTSDKDVAEAENGDVIAGRKEDISTIGVEKFYDFRVAKDHADDIQRSLEASFLMMAGIQRQAERVTAEEIRNLVHELESGLGGVYSILSQELQLPLASALMDRMAAEKRLPKLPKKIVKTTVVTGVEALGRGNDLQKLDALLAGVAQVFGPEAIARYVVAGEYLERRAAALGVDTEGLIRTEEQLAQADQQAQQNSTLADIATRVAPEVVKQAGAAQAAQA
jgi:hypothetical protein